MLEEALVKFCAPTLAGIKTASLFNTSSFPSLDLLQRQRQEVEPKLARAGLDTRLFHRPNQVPLFYIYRPQALEEDLRHPLAQARLQQMDYDLRDASHALAGLAQRLYHAREFPHEIGYFLSYPPEDVEAFIEKGPTCSLCKGYWCVYSNQDACLTQFAHFDRCHQSYRTHYAQHHCLDSLLVPNPIAV